MDYIVKITKYKHRYGINIPIDIVRKAQLQDRDYMIIQVNNYGLIKMRGYIDDEKTERSGKADRHNSD